MALKPTAQEEENYEQSVIIPAGAILWQGTPFSSDIAVIHRIRYGSEWCLPKGKSNPLLHNRPIVNLINFKNGNKIQ